MRLQKPLSGIALAVALALALPAAAGGKAERIGAFSGGAPDWIKPLLEPQGYRVARSDGSVVGDVWFRKNVPALKVSTFVGVITFPAEFSDFRAQKVKAGTYTMRFAEMPSDGDHLGAAPSNTFLLLSPVAEDTEAGDDLTFKEVTKMSAKTTGTNHPSPMWLSDVSAQKDFPAVATNSYGHEVFFVKLKQAGGAELPIGFVVKGRTEHEV
jgi:hypothetical protein